MTAWLISTNPKMFNHSEAFAKHDYVDWIQFADYEVGDIVYIYATKPEGMIRYKTTVVKTGMSFPEIENDERLWFDTRDLRREKMKYSRLKLLKRLDSSMLDLENLKQHGLKNAPQRVKRLEGGLLGYIELLD